MPSLVTWISYTSFRRVIFFVVLWY
jgi:hypothetical protein